MVQSHPLRRCNNFAILLLLTVHVETKTIKPSTLTTSRFWRSQHERKRSSSFNFKINSFEEILMDKNHMSALRTKHEALDRKINEEETRPLPDTIRIHSLKKEKLRLKEELLDSA
tara:strand:- start:493 stop:837 length:345 start_codon:yes stop_codon:yes gene_type:complete